MAEKSGGRNRRCCRNRSRPLGAGCRLRWERQCGGRISAQAEKTLAEVSSGGYECQEAVSCSGSGTEESRRQTIARSAAASPLPFVTAEDERYALEKIMQPVADAMIAEGCPFEGVLYGGLMKTARGIEVIEFNARFGDPETEVVLPRLKSDIADIFCAVAEGHDTQLEWHDFAALGIVLASKGYPGDYEKGHEIKGLDRVEGAVYHMGTRADGGRILTNGGRVLFVVGKGRDLAEARRNALADVARIDCDNLFHRTDIGHRAFDDLER